MRRLAAAATVVLPLLRRVLLVPLLVLLPLVQQQPADAQAGHDRTASGWCGGGAAEFSASEYSGGAGGAASMEEALTLLLSVEGDLAAGVARGCVDRLVSARAQSARCLCF